MLMKQFVLAMIACAATSFAMADSLDLPINNDTDLSSGWDSSYDGATHTITYASAWSGRGWWLGDTDYSAYKKVVVEVEATSMNGNFNIEYADGTTASASVYFNPGTTELVYDFDEVGKSHVKQIYIQGGAVGTITIKRAYLTDGQDDPVWEAEGKSLAFDEYGNILASEFNGYTDDAQVTFTYAITGAAGYINWGIGAVSSLGNASLKTDLPVKNEGENTMSMKFGKLKEYLNAGPDQYDRYGLNWNLWSFDGCTATRVSCVVRELVGATGEQYVAPGTSAIESVTVAPAAKTLFNLAGQRAASGLVIKEGKVVYIK